jgi:hypothetical protein
MSGRIGIKLPWYVRWALRIAYGKGATVVKTTSATSVVAVAEDLKAEDDAHSLRAHGMESKGWWEQKS